MPPSLDTIVCGVDGSPPARCAAQVAIGLARALRAQLVLAHVSGVVPLPAPVLPVGTDAPSAEPVRETLAVDAATEEQVVDWLAAFADDVGADDAEQLVVPFGDPARRLAAVAEEREAGLLVVGTRGRSAVRDALLGSVSARLAADAPAPVLTVPPGSLVSTDWVGRRLVCGFDGSESASRGALFAAALAARTNSDLQIVAVMDGAAEAPDPDQPLEAELQAVAFATSSSAADGAGQGIRIDRDRRRGEPAEQLERVAAAATAPAIVMGTRGRPPWRAALLGSVSRRVLDIARRPVILVPPGAVVAEAPGVRPRSGRA